MVIQLCQLLLILEQGFKNYMISREIFKDLIYTQRKPTKSETSFTPSFISIAVPLVETADANIFNPKVRSTITVGYTQYIYDSGVSTFKMLNSSYE